MRRWRWTTANVRLVGGMPGRRVHEGGTPSECGLVCVSRTQGGARPQRADPGLGGATALRLADSEPRRDAPAIGTSTLDLRQSKQAPGLAFTLTAAGTAVWNTETRTSGCTPGGLAPVASGQSSVPPA